MATGLSKREKHGDDALTAALPHLDPHPLPPQTAAPILDYPGRLSISEVLAPMPAEFRAIDQCGDATPRNAVPNSLVLSDNLFALHDMLKTGQKVTLFYLDPPYNTGMEFHSRQLEHSYKDCWHDAAYIEFMRRRLILMRELLTDDGSIYVHIDQRMLCYLKVIMDEVFGSDNFRNLITRRKCSSKNFTKHQYANLNDYLLFYSKSDSYKWNQPGERASEEWVDKEYPYKDAKGRYKLVPVHAPGTRQGATGGEWRGRLPPPGKHWQYVPSKLDAFDAAGEMHWSRNGNPRRKVYLTANKLVPYTDYWGGFRDAHHQSVAVTGYPTEKNSEMLKMIVGASSDPGDLVVDPFCGSATTMQAAEELGRKWIGIDQSFAALKASIKRFRHGVDAMGDFVERKHKRQGAKVIDLFGADDVQSVPPSPRNRLPPAEFSFVVDAELLEPFATEIKALAST